MESRRGFTPTLDRAPKRQNDFLGNLRLLGQFNGSQIRQNLNFRRFENRSARLSAGFTLIEILVVVSITVLLSTILVVYSRSGENQAALFKEQAKVIGILLKAKNLSLQSYAVEGGGPICGYGVHLDVAKNEFLIFKDSADSCSSSDNKYSGSNEDLEKHLLDSRLKFLSSEFIDILFIPPDPTVIIDGDIDKSGQFSVTIESIDGVGIKKIGVNNSGQVTAN